MSGKIALESPGSTVTRRQPLLTTTLASSTGKDDRVDAKDGGGSRRGSRIGEAAGECAAVCCCCPCAMMHLIILAVYRLPRGLWRKKKRTRLLRKKRKKSSGEEKENQRKTNSSSGGGKEGESSTEDDEELRGENDAVDWDNEMWGRFNGAGFWRSASQRKDDES
ncbi:hypothetical protein Salat_0388900 [Sesamum alatum]|uniref:Pollen preferential protein n=1 Tax=Sesamum alatum TaxID=300844 RepID=A0AAE2CZW3_9LAMI|nr:hypothetical protein Salat_0388900 [Sesamum alatum]